MEKKTNFCLKNLCEKIHKTFTGSPAFQAIRRISHRLNHSQSAIPASSVKIIDYQVNPKPSSVPISFDSASQNPVKNGKPSSGNPPEPGNKNTQVAKIASRKETEAASGNKIVEKQNPDGEDKAKSHRENLEKGRKSGIHIEDRFTEYINNARIKIGSVHNSDEGKNFSGKGKKSENSSWKDHNFSDFIDRTKKKLRTTSSIGSGKTSSFK